MKTSTKLIATGAASVLGLALAVGGAQAASGSLTVHDAPGHVVQVSGVVPVSAQASLTATAHANHNAKGLSGATVAHPTARATTHATTHVTMHVTMHAAVRQVARPAAQPLPAYHAYRSDCGSDYGHTGMSGSGSHMR
ncbi:MAG TPA: hypothetical protein VIJ07_11730 [Dermatophilaceae bacterium]